jgi:hypothetical protein
VKGLAEMTAENDVLVARARKRETDSLKRLKQRIARVSWQFDYVKDVAAMRRKINECIDQWHEAEQKRGAR